MREDAKQEPTLQGKKISIKRVSKCKSILVKNLPNSATLESVRRLFRNKTVGGDGVENVTLDLEKRTAMVQFKDPDGIQSIITFY